MLNVVTGLPGACKTLYTLSKLIPQYRGRSIYVYGIPGIDHEYFGTEPLKDPEKWYKLPEGSVIVMDEAQSIFPLRKAGSPVPKKCSEFETHRHKGFDIILITQDATTLDIHIRKLAGGHIHCRRLFGTQSATIYVYQKHQPKPEDRNTIRSAISSSTWKFDKSVYDHYKSADLHTVRRRIPTRLILVPVVVVAAVFATWFAVTTIASMFSEDKKFVEESMQKGLFEEEPAKAELVFHGPAAWLAARTPVVEGMPWTAPIYNDVFQIVTFPKPHCVIVDRLEGPGGSRCTCYTQQITRMEDVDPDICRQIASRGWFDPTKVIRQSRNRAQREPAARAPQRDSKGRDLSTNKLRIDPVRSKIRYKDDLDAWEASR